MTASNDRFAQQLRFIVELDRLKTVLRQSTLTDGSRRENSAEHSWHLAMMAPLLLEYAPEGTDLLRVLRMVLVHDVVEIDAGDTFAYDAAGYADKAEREEAAARRIFGLLPADQNADLTALWREFEARETPDARYANALDRLQPFLQNVHAAGGTWRTHGVTKVQVLTRMRPIADVSPGLWTYVVRTLEEVWESAIERRAEDLP